MSHSITVLNLRAGRRADEILVALAEHLGVAQISPDNAGHAQIWLQLDPGRAEAAVRAALQETATDWQEHIEIVRPAP